MEPFTSWQCLISSFIWYNTEAQRPQVLGDVCVYVLFCAGLGSCKGGYRWRLLAGTILPYIDIAFSSSLNIIYMALCVPHMHNTRPYIAHTLKSFVWKHSAVASQGYQAKHSVLSVVECYPGLVTCKLPI